MVLRLHLNITSETFAVSHYRLSWFQRLPKTKVCLVKFCQERSLQPRNQFLATQSGLVQVQQKVSVHNSKSQILVVRAICYSSNRPECCGSFSKQILDITCTQSFQTEHKNQFNITFLIENQKSSSARPLHKLVKSAAIQNYTQCTEIVKWSPIVSFDRQHQRFLPSAAFSLFTNL